MNIIKNFIVNSNTLEVIDMRKLFASAVFTAAAFCSMSAEASDPRWGYAFLSNSQTLVSNEPVSWSGEQGTFSEGVYLNIADPTIVIIKHPGVYLVRYSTTVEVLATSDGTDDGDAQFALYLNESIVPGSIYGVGNAYSSDFITYYFDAIFDDDLVYDAETQCNGQVILKVRDHFSQLTLKNHCENVLELSATAGTDDPIDWGNNVAASIFVERIDKICDE
jgi:hypothetical protein